MVAMMTPEEYDPPTYGGTPMQEAHAEMIQIFGWENPTEQWILTDYDVWERNPYYHGPDQPHPEDYNPETGEFNPPFVPQPEEDVVEDVYNEDDIPF